MRRRILTNNIIIIIISALITGALAFYFIRFSNLQNKEEKLLSNLNLIENTIKSEYILNPNLNFYRLAQDFALQTNSRVTFIDSRGKPLADSINNSIIFDNLSNELEYKYANNGQQIIVRRYSPEIGENYFYLGLKSSAIGEDDIIIRLGESMNNIDHIIERFLVYLVLSVFIAILVTYIISFFNVKKITKPINDLTIASKLIAAGEFDYKININTRDEIEELALNFNHMSSELKAYIDSVKEVDRMRKDFVANVSHELRTPLTSISGFVETLKLKDLDNENKMKALNIIECETNRLIGLINKLLTLSKIESIKEVNYNSEIDIRGDVNEVIELLTSQIKTKNIEVDLKIEHNLNKTYGDNDLFKLVFINILENSIKFNSNGGYIMVQISNYDKGIKMTVEDNGIGISKDDIKKIFERFYRVDKSKLYNANGTGLGLSITKNIISNFGGRIEVVSELNKGSKFTIFLPK